VKCRFLIVTSSSDQASLNIRAGILGQYPFRALGMSYDGSEVYALGDIRLVTLASPLPLIDHLDRDFDVDAYIFASKHVSERGTAALTAHFPGNFGPVTFGGRPDELAYAYPSLLRSYLLELWGRRSDLQSYDITLEASHHGPTSLGRPAIFIELGSTPREWLDLDAGRIIAQSLMSALNNLRETEKIACALGGPHYSDKFRHMILDEGYALAAVCSKHSLPYLSSHLLSQMIRKSIEPVSRVLVDWKGLGREKDRVVRLLAGLNIEVERV